MDEILQAIWDYLGRNAATLIALSALLLTVYEAYETRRHNRLSLKPHIRSFAMKSFNADTVSIHWYLINNGLGPAVIKSYSVYLDEQPMDTRTATGVVEAITKVFGGGIIKSGPHMDNIADNDILRVSDTKNILKVDISFSWEKMKHYSELNDVDSRLNRFTVEVKYESLYGEPFSFATTR